MKLALGLLVILAALTGMAQSNTNHSPTCFNATTEKDNASVIGRVELRRHFLNLSYLSANAEVLEVYTGTAKRVQKTANGFKVVNVFVRDRGVGWIEGLDVEVMKTVVIIKQKDGSARSQRIVNCPSAGK